MKPESILYEAIQKPTSEERETFLDEACGTDLPLRLLMEELVYAHEARGSFLEKPAMESLANTDHEGSKKPDCMSFSMDVENPGEIPTQTFAALDPTPGIVIAGRYLLEKKVGEGGMGEVWIARQTEPVQRRVALKFVKTGLEHQAYVARFDQERQALAIMDHPNIAKIFDGGTTENGRPFFVMELVHGLPITKYCDKEKLTPRERLALFASVCQGVQHAHQKGIIHRDIKPSNILVGIYDGKPVPKIIDFGVAKATGQRLSRLTVDTEIGSPLGTLEYMSPEQADLTNVDIDTRTDVYALGVILYELLTGTVPFTRKDFAEAGLMQMLMVIKEKEPPKPSTRLSTLKELPSIAAHRRSDPARLQHLLAGELDWIIMKCLEKERNRRYDSPILLANDLERYLANRPVEAAPPSTLYRVRKFVNRYRGQVLVSGLLLTMLIGSVIATSIGMWMAKLAEENAHKEAELHRALLEYIEHDLYGQFDPDIRGQIGFFANHNITVKTQLDNATKLIGKRSKDMPDRVQAAIRKTIGIGYSSLGENVEALAQLEMARKLIPDNDPMVIKINEAIARILHHQGIMPINMDKLNEAEKLLLDCVRTRTVVEGPKAPATLRTRYDLGSVERSMGKWHEAEERLTVLLKEQTQVLPADNPDVPRTMLILAEIYWNQKRDALAEKMNRDALAFCRQNLPPNHPQTFKTMNNLAHYLRTRKQYPESIQLYDELINAASKVYDKDDPDLLTMKFNQAVCYWYSGKPSKLNEAEAILQEVLASALRITSSDNSTVLETKQSLSSIAFKKGDWAQAILRYDEILETFKKVYGTYSPKTWEVMENLAYACNETKKHDRCFNMVKELLTYITESPQTLDSERYYRVVCLAYIVCMQNGQRDELERVLRRALEVLPPGTPDHEDVARTLKKLQKESADKGRNKPSEK